MPPRRGGFFGALALWTGASCAGGGSAGGSSAHASEGPEVAVSTESAGLTHRLRVYLIDSQRRIRNIYGLDFLDPDLLLADVRTLVLEERGSRR